MRVTTVPRPFDAYPVARQRAISGRGRTGGMYGHAAYKRARRRLFKVYSDRSAMDSAAGFYPASEGSIPSGRANMSGGARAVPEHVSDGAGSHPEQHRLVTEGLSSGMRAEQASRPAGKSGSLTSANNRLVDGTLMDSSGAREGQ